MIWWRSKSLDVGLTDFHERHGAGLERRLPAMRPFARNACQEIARKLLGTWVGGREGDEGEAEVADLGE